MAIISIIEVSEKTADLLYTLGYITLILSAVAAVLGTIWLMWGDAAKSKYSGREMQKLKTEAARANERAAVLEKDAAVLTARAAALEHETALARLELETLKEKQRPRGVTPEQKMAVLKHLAGKRFPKLLEVDINGSDGEQLEYAKQLADAFSASGMQTVIQHTMWGMTIPAGTINVVSEPPGLTTESKEVFEALKSADLRADVMILSKAGALETKVILILGQRVPEYQTKKLPIDPKYQIVIPNNP